MAQDMARIVSRYFTLDYEVKPCAMFCYPSDQSSLRKIIQSLWMHFHRNKVLHHDAQKASLKSKKSKNLVLHGGRSSGFDLPDSSLQVAPLNHRSILEI